MKKLIAITILSIVITFPVYAQSIGGWSGSGIPASYLDTDGALTANSDAKVASQKATKTYADTKQVNLSILKGTYTNGYFCTYASSGTLLNCNTNPATYQAALDLVKGTYADGGYCKYTASGTLIDCNSMLGTDFPGISGTITDEQLLCGENTDGTNKIKSCGAKTTGFDTLATGEATFKTDTSVVGNMTKSSTDGTFRGLTMGMTAGETLTFGAPVYMKSDGKVWKADADAAATMPAIGIIVVGGNAEATVTVLTHGVVTETDWNWTVGATIYVADGDAGALTATVGDISDTNDVVQVIGIAIHADTIFVNPSLTTIVLE